MAQSVAEQLQNRVSFRRAMKRSLASAVRSGAQGVKVQCGGRLGGTEMSRTEKYSEGRVPLHTLRADIDYGFAEAKMTYGRIGVKVWMNKGEIMPEGYEVADAQTRLGEVDARRRRAAPAARQGGARADARRTPAGAASGRRPRRWRWRRRRRSCRGRARWRARRPRGQVRPPLSARAASAAGRAGGPRRGLRPRRGPADRLAGRGADRNRHPADSRGVRADAPASPGQAPPRVPRPPHGVTKGGSRVNFGEYGLKSLEGGSAEPSIEAARIAMTRKIKRGGKVWINIFPDKPVTEKTSSRPAWAPARARPRVWVAVVEPGRVMFELAGVPEPLAREAMRLAAQKLPIRCKFVEREGDLFEG